MKKRRFDLRLLWSRCLAGIASDAKPRWPESARAVVTPTPAPRPTPKPRLVYAPAPAFPSEVRSRPGAVWSGRFRLNFNARGNVTNVQVVQSTGNIVIDQSALSTLRQWKSAPGPGMGSDGSCHISKQVKAETAAAGFRVKSGWAAVVLLTGPIGSPALRDNRMIDLSDPRVPETRQPYHATFGQLETDAKKINRRTDIVHRITKQSITDLLSDYRRKGYSITRRLSGSWKPDRSCFNRESCTFARTRSRASYFARRSSRL